MAILKKDILKKLKKTADIIEIVFLIIAILVSKVLETIYGFDLTVTIPLLLVFILVQKLFNIKNK